MKTAKRQAEVGEKIVIVKKLYAFEPHKVGDIFTVQWREDFELIHTEEGGVIIFDEEYEVILEDENEQ